MSDFLCIGVECASLTLSHRSSLLERAPLKAYCKVMSSDSWIYWLVSSCSFLRVHISVYHGFYFLSSLAQSLVGEDENFVQCVVWHSMHHQQSKHDSTYNNMLYLVLLSLAFLELTLSTPFSPLSSPFVRIKYYVLDMKMIRKVGLI